MLQFLGEKEDTRSKPSRVAMQILVKDFTSEELHGQLAPLGVPIKLARQVQMAALRGRDIPQSVHGRWTQLLAVISQVARVPNLRLIERVDSPADGFAKYLFEGDGPDRFETVRIPLLHRANDPKYIVCVSSQVGCALGCTFCATGRMGFRRNLQTWEIVDQVIKVQADSPHPVRGVVFMGMGEPMLNYDCVIRAARILSEPCGMAISGKAITISTAGIVPGIRRFTAERHPFRLVVSLNSAEPDERRALMPIDRTYPLSEVIAAVRAYQAATRQRVTLAWTMISGVNTRPEDARALARLTAGMPIKLDLIDVNDPTGRFKPPSAEELNAFRDSLRAELGMPVVRRYSGGAAIHAACGMLAANEHARLPT
jgi:23S rRNA (adenine2503-C2)-methyltransferase